MSKSTISTFQLFEMFPTAESTGENPCTPDYDFHSIDIARKYVHFSLVEDDMAGLCWAGDHFPDIPLSVTGDISNVTCEFCKEHWHTLNNLSKALAT